MATSPTPPRLVVATSTTTGTPASATTGVVTEATIQQLLDARTKIARRAGSLDRELKQRSARDRRDFAEQAAQQLASAAPDFDARTADPLMAKLKALDDAAAKDAATLEALRRTAVAIEDRIEEIKDSPDRELLAAALERERRRLDQERVERQEDADLLALMIEQIQSDLDEIGAAIAFLSAPAPSDAAESAASATDTALASTAADSPAPSSAKGKSRS